MLNGIKDFFYRHRRKFVITGIFLGSGVFLIRIIQYKLRQFQDRQAKEIAEKFKRMQHFESTERTCNQTIHGLMPLVVENTLKILDTNMILEKLRSNPDNKLELWEELKILAFTRVVAVVYATSMLAVTLKVQVHLLGGYLYKDTKEQEDKRITTGIQITYLSMIQYFMDDGLDKLIDVIRRNVSVTMQRYSLKQKLSLADTETLLWSIQMALSNDEQSPTKFIAKYTLPNEVNQGNLPSTMYEETLDVLESVEVIDVCFSSISSGFSAVVDKLAEYYAEADSAQATPCTSKSSLNAEPLFNINEIKISLAKLVPIACGLISTNLGNNGGSVANGLNENES